MRLMPRTRGGALWRFFLASVLVIASVAATTAVAGLLQVRQLIQDIGGNPGEIITKAPVTIANPGDPQTILVIGSDHRAGEPFTTANTDTMMLVRLNPNSQTINVMSIPRDLEVQVPGFGTAKINSAYQDGGTRLLVKTIKANVFPNLRVNHIVDVNFSGFIALVNQIHCVYSDIDHRYYNNTAYTGYSSINIQPGYQRLCGFRALQFVRFRHTDSDLVRNARQQDFIRWAKDQYGVGNLIANRDSLLHTFGKYTETDHNLRTTDGLLNLFQLVAFSAGHTIKQIKFEANEQLPCGQTTVGGAVTPCYLTATTESEGGEFRAFMRPTNATAVAKSAKKATGGKSRSAKIQAAGLIADTSDGKSQAAAVAHIGMQVYFPRLVVSGSNYCSSLTGNCPTEVASPGSYPRAYTIRDQKGHGYAAYRMTLEINPLLGEYYGVQGTTWPNPPLLASPTQTKLVGGKKLLLFANGGKLTTVAWKTPHGTYWISNTLTTDIPNRELVSIAASLTRGA
jgi:LCP family protein required for cell wall assembly